MAYSKTTWADNDVITKDKLNNLETGVETANAGIMTGSATAIEALATPESATSQDIANKVNEIITQLKARGVIL